MLLFVLERCLILHPPLRVPSTDSKEMGGWVCLPFNIYFHNIEAPCSLTSGNGTVLCGSHADIHGVTQALRMSTSHQFGAYLGEGALCACS